MLGFGLRYFITNVITFVFDALLMEQKKKFDAKIFTNDLYLQIGIVFEKNYARGISLGPEKLKQAEVMQVKEV